jgi:hypothetical protein
MFKTKKLFNSGVLERRTDVREGPIRSFNPMFQADFSAPAEGPHKRNKAQNTRAAKVFSFSIPAMRRSEVLNGPDRPSSVT